MTRQTGQCSGPVRNLVRAADAATLEGEDSSETGLLFSSATPILSVNRVLAQVRRRSQRQAGDRRLVLRALGDHQGAAELESGYPGALLPN